ncbi:TNF receptor-associated factor 3-like [Dysidea avara]|uniref:TNF receptor-associated factor 3-like n=1 Tax=Dysidea avara TaxID=196820 RepID=UPI0033197BEE
MTAPIGGYEYQFVTTPPDWLMCCICHYPGKEPYLSGCCGQTFCKSCLEGVEETTIINAACPMCRCEKYVTIPNKQADRLVRSLHVLCTNKERGCEWQGEVNDIIGHLESNEGCSFQDVKCPNECGKCTQRQYLTSHVENECVLRIANCQYCHITGECQFIEGKHKEECLLLPIPCPNKCEVHTILRQDIDAHKDTCLLEKVTCSSGCGLTLERQYLTTHIEDECPCYEVYCKCCHIAGERRFIEYDHKEQCLKFPVPCPNMCEVASVLRYQIEEHLELCPLEVVPCDYHIVGCEERMARKDKKEHNHKKIEEHLSFTKDSLTMKVQQAAKEQSGEESKNDLSLKLQQTQNDLMITKQKLAATMESLQLSQQEIAVTQKNLISTENKLTHTTDILKSLQEDSKRTIDELTQKFANDKRILYNKITEIEIKLQQQEKTHEVDWMLVSNWYKSIYVMATKLSSGDKVVPVVVRISDYITKKRNEVSWHSNSFYTHHGGYKMCLKVSFTGPHLFIGLVLMKGPNDDKLKWPLVGQCGIVLFNQIRNSEHYLGDGKYSTRGFQRVTTGEMSACCMWYNACFIIDEDLHKITATRQYLRDNNIFFHVDYNLECA